MRWKSTQISSNYVIWVEHSVLLGTFPKSLETVRNCSDLTKIVVITLDSEFFEFDEISSSSLSYFAKDSIFFAASTTIALSIVNLFAIFMSSLQSDRCALKRIEQRIQTDMKLAPVFNISHWYCVLWFFRDLFRCVCELYKQRKEMHECKEL